MFWPVEKKNIPLPTDKTAGGFLEDRGDRIHCGIDIHVPKGSKIFAIEKGVVVNSSLFTSPKIIPYWNDTYQLIIKSSSGLFYRYAELEQPIIQRGQYINAGDLIGLVSQVLNPIKVSNECPEYIQRLAIEGKNSMLHLEVYDIEPIQSPLYLGGNWFEKTPPNGLINPLSILKRIIHDEIEESSTFIKSNI